MTQDSAVEDIVHRHAKAIVTMDIGQIMNDLMPDAMMKLQQEAGGGTAMQINSYELLGNSRDGDDYLYDVKYIGPQSFTVRARWSRVGPEWKIIDADIIAVDTVVLIRHFQVLVQTWSLACAPFKADRRQRTALGAQELR